MRISANGAILIARGWVDPRPVRLVVYATNGWITRANLSRPCKLHLVRLRWRHSFPGHWRHRPESPWWHRPGKSIGFVQDVTGARAGCSKVDPLLVRSFAAIRKILRQKKPPYSKICLHIDLYITAASLVTSQSPQFVGESRNYNDNGPGPLDRRRFLYTYRVGQKSKLLYCDRYFTG